MTSVLLSAAGSLAAAIMVARSIFYTFLPDELSSYLSSILCSFLAHFSSTLTFVVDEIDGLQPNHLYDAASSYLSAMTTTPAADSSSLRRLKLTKHDAHDPALHVSVDRNQQVLDSFDGVPFRWTLVCRHVEQPTTPHGARHLGSTLGGRSELRSLELVFHKKHKSKALERYLPHVVSTAKKMKEENKAIKLYTTDEERMYALSEMWSGVNLSHPATFDTLAMDPDAKKMVLDDLHRFLKRRDYYRRVGKAWKRGYLLYGPPGTGKSSLVAAVANYLKFDVYDLELGMLRSNSELRRLLVGTANRSILVVEDIDCSIKLKNRELDDEEDCATPTPAGYHQQTKITLSGLLNFIDGLWSSCGDERIIIFTTNHKEKLDPALLRPGRMDMHIHMSYCSRSSFQVLARNYLGVYESEGLFKEAEELIGELNVTPAEVAEQLMRDEDDEVALRGLIGFLEKKKMELKGKEKEAIADISHELN